LHKSVFELIKTKIKANIHEILSFEIYKQANEKILWESEAVPLVKKDIYLLIDQVIKAYFVL